VFGVTPDEAQKLTGAPVVTPQGVFQNGEPVEMDPPTYRARIQGKAVAWTPANFGTFDDPEPSGSMSRAPRIVRKFLYEATDGKVGDAAGQLEAAGARNVTVYSHGAVDGWAPVREHSFTDGQALYLHRTRDPELTSQHGTTVYVRPERAETLPVSLPTTTDAFENRGDGTFLVNNAAIVDPKGSVDEPGIEFWKLTRDGSRPSAVTVDTRSAMPTVTPIFGDATPSSTTASLSGGRAVFHSDGTNLIEAVSAALALSRIGVPRDRIEIRSKTDSLRLA
jgi:hypothetical protein